MSAGARKTGRGIFLAGASGAIGRPLCRILVAEGWQVFGTTRRTEKVPALQALGIEPVVVDVFDADRLTRLMQEARPRIVIHQLTDLPPGLDPARMADARARNARLRDVGTRNLVAAAAACGAERLIAESISFAYAPGPRPFREDAALDVDAPDEAARLTAQAVESLERQVLAGPFVGIVLRYGKLYGPGTGFERPSAGGAVHVEAAADAARRATVRGSAGVYNIAEDDGAVTSTKAARELDWRADFRLTAIAH